MSIPIVGQQSALLYWYPTAALHCRCNHDKMNVVVLTGFNNHVQCSECGKLYHIAGIETRDGKTAISIGMVLPTPSDQVN
jgi:hypothetical protein